MQTRRGRARTGRFLAEGIRVVEDLLASELRVFWVACASSLEDSERGAKLAATIDEAGIPRRPVNDAVFATLAATDTPQGVIAVAGIPRPEVNCLDQPAAQEVVLLLDGVQDPGNFGTLVRSAEALGACCVIALSGTVDPWNPKSVRAAAGSSFRVPVVQSEVAPGFDRLREAGYTLLGGAMGGRPVAEVRAQRVGLVVGNEGAGLSQDVLERLDDVVAVPLRGRAESLNVAAAAAILLYELTR